VQDLSEIPLNTTDIPQSTLNIDVRNRRNLFPWNGQFSPQLAEALLRAYASPDDTVLDPFAGSGTVLYEAARLGLAAIGTEINPAAYYMGSTYEYVNMPPGDRERALASIDRRLLETLVILPDAWERLRSLILSLPYSRRSIKLWHADARRLPKTTVADLVDTSPPYINVFNYHQQFRAAAESLGWNLLNVARAEIGSNRKHRQNRFLTVIQYCLDMTQALAAAAAATSPSARLILVVGRESQVRGTPFFNGSIMLKLAIEVVGLACAGRQERVFKNRFGQLIYEDILHFVKDKRISGQLDAARVVADSLLRDAFERAPSEAHADLHAAIESVPSVEPSPLFDPASARNHV
jgi:hypothetical protein